MRISRRTRFALPLVLVVGCGSSPKLPTTTTEDNSDPKGSAAADASALPDPPGSGNVTTSTLDNGVTVLTYDSGDRVYVHADGTCHAEYSCGGGRLEPSAEPVTCNPPPPQQVKCPTNPK